MLNRKIVEASDRLARSEEHNIPIIEMATVGRFIARKGNKPKGAERKVFTTSDTMPTVHVHVWDTNTNGKELSVCVRLDKPEYFIHDSATDTFSKDDLEGFINFMKSDYNGKMEYDGCKIRTNWDYTVVQWNNENPTNEMKIMRGDDGYVITPPMPDYTKLR